MTQQSGKFPPQVFELFDKYVHGMISRRNFIDSASKLAIAGLSGAAILEALNPKFAQAQQVKPDDARIKARYIEIPVPGYGKSRGYLVSPAKPVGKLPTILVVHENRGLNPHIEDIARRVALDDFIAFAPDALFPLGGYPGDEDKAREMFRKLDQAKTHQDFVAAARYLEHLPEGSGKVGVVGFCYGGGIANYVAAHVPELAAAVPFYGTGPDKEDIGHIKAPLLLHFAENDQRVTGAWPAYEAELKAAGVSYQAFIYPDTQHGFNNDTTPRYNETAAKLAWQRTMDFFNEHLRS